MLAKIARFLLVGAMLMVVVTACGGQQSATKEQDLLHVKSLNTGPAKKVIFLLVDSLMAHAIDRGIEQNELPAFRFLTEHGRYYKDVVSSYPTMSVAIDSSLMTGTYPDGHRIPGLVWYSEDEQRVVNYGTGPMEIMKQGIHPVVADALINLNGKHLSREQTTIYEELAQRGLKSGSINGLIYRGTAKHQLSIPRWAQAAAQLPGQIEVQGPDFLALASLSNPLEGTHDLPDGLTHRMGLDNSYSMEVVKYLVQHNRLPDFLLVYLPDMDQKLHRKGPDDLKGIKELDKQLYELLQAFGTPEEALKQTVFVLAGDSGMTAIKEKKQRPVIDLSSVFKDYNVLPTGGTVADSTDIVLAVNETMAYVYKLKPNMSLRELAQLLQADERIDIISWKEGDWIYTIQGAASGEARYKAEGPLTDSYGQKWTVEQDAKVLDVTIDAANQTIQYGNYPDVLRRLFGALHSHSGDFLVVNAKPGYELADRSSPTHKGGGGHGAIGKQESLVPLIVAGTDQQPQFLRIVDLKSFFLKLLTMPKG
ncbi:alkaline phosphatase family protein [Paenibacillus sp. GCM10027626]|uniref:alkaline phosphatase family protein n=1 Tax=Paenibacillus sp. GCM10027626 TaxID=3273411 RepID=UPI00362C6BEB